MLIKKPDYEEEIFSKSLIEKLEFACACSKLIIINVNKKLTKQHCKLLTLLNKKKQIVISHGGLKSNSLTILIHGIAFQFQKTIEQTTREYLKQEECFEDSETPFELQIKSVAPAKVQAETICPSYLSTIRTILSKNVSLSLLTHINNVSGTTGAYIACYIELYTKTRAHIGLDDIDFNDLRRRSFFMMLKNASTECISGYKHSMQIFLNKCSPVSLRILLEEHDRILSYGIIPSFMKYTKGIPFEDFAIVEQVLFMTIRDICVFSLDGVVSGILLEAIHNNKEKSRSYGLNLQKKYNELFEKIDSTHDPLDVFRTMLENLESERDRTGPKYPQTFKNIIEQLSTILSKKHPSMVWLLNSKSSNLISSVEKVSSLEKYLGYYHRYTTTIHLLQRTLRNIYYNEYSALTSTLKSMNTVSTNSYFEDLTKQLKNIRSMLKTYDSIVKNLPLTKVKIENNVISQNRNIQNSKRTLHIKKCDLAIYEFLSSKGILPEVLLNCDLSSTEGDDDNNQIDSSLGRDHNKIHVCQFYNKTKRPLLLMTYSSEIGIVHNMQKEKKYPILVERSYGSEPFTIEFFIKYKTKSGLSMSSTFTLLGKSISCYNTEKNLKNLYNKMKFSGQIENSDDDILTTSILTFGKMSFLVPVVIINTEKVVF